MRALLLAACLAAPPVSAQIVPDEHYGDFGFAVAAVPGGASVWGAAAVTADGLPVVAGSQALAGTPSYVGLVARLTASGQPDPSFGASGIVLLGDLPLAPGGTLLSSELYTVSTLADGRIMAGGRAWVNGADGVLARLEIVVMLTRDGLLDSTFGVGGVARVPGVSIRRVFETAAGFVLFQYDEIAPRRLRRLHPDGALDTSFGERSLPGLIDFGDLAARPDGSLVVLGTAVATENPEDDRDIGLWALRADGTPDSTFSGDGILSEDIFAGRDAGVALTMTADGSFLASGSATKQSGTGVVLYRVTHDGRPDPSFGFEGWVWSDVHPTGAPTLPVVELPGRPFVTPDGSISVLVGGSRLTSGLRILGVTESGIPDTRYGLSGVATVFNSAFLSFFGSTHAGGVVLGTGKVGNQLYTVRLVEKRPVADEILPVVAGALTVTPNPSAGDARIALALHAPATTRVCIVDALGRTVATLADGTLGAGEHSFAADGLAPGVYAVVAEAGDARSVARLTVVR